MAEILDRPISVTFVLIALNVALSLVGFWGLARDPHRRWFLFMPYRVARGEGWTGALLSHFAHADLGHLFLNMVTLYFFGPRVEAELGPRAYLVLYAASGIAGTLLVFLLRRKDPAYAALGASGAIAGVMFAVVVIAPTATMYLLFVPVPLPAPVFAVLYVVASSLMMRRGGDSVAHEAHLGGALGGVLITILVYPDALGIFLRQLGL